MNEISCYYIYLSREKKIYLLKLICWVALVLSGDKYLSQEGIQGWWYLCLTLCLDFDSINIHNLCKQGKRETPNV